MASPTPSLHSPAAPDVLYIPPTPYFENLSLRSRNGNRSSLVRSLIQSSQLLSRCTQAQLRIATFQEAALAHSHQYLQLLQELSDIVDQQTPYDEDVDCSTDLLPHTDRRIEEAGLVDDCPIFPGVWPLAMLTVGGAVVAAEHLIAGTASVACWFDGGRHHAAADSAHGFCYLNDVVVACKTLLSAKHISRILYLDIDIHHGDGVENAFLYTDAVVTVSFHMSIPGFFPNTGGKVLAGHGKYKRSAVRVPLKRGIRDESFSQLFHHVSTLLYDHCNPHAVVLQCGLDGLAADPLGGFNLTADAFTASVQHILSWNKPTLILGGGGYHSPNAARVWTDVLDCCIRCKSPTRPDTTYSRDIPIDDQFFDQYAPSFSRDVKPLQMNDENNDNALRAITDNLSAAFSRKR